MTKNQFREKVNGRLKQVLRDARLQSGTSISNMAAALNLSESELCAIEEKPGEVPGCKLYQVIEYYGPSTEAEIQAALCDIHFLGVEYRASRSWFEKAGRRLRSEFVRHRRVILVVVFLHILTNLWRSFR